MRKRLYLAVLILPLASAVSAQTPKPFVHDALQELERAVGGPVQATVSPTTGLVTFLTFAAHQRPLVRLSGAAPAEERAMAFLDDYGAAFGILGRDTLSLDREAFADEVGMEHVRFRQTHQGVPVTGGELTVHLRSSAVVAVNAKTLADLETVDTSPMLSAAEASVLATEALARDLGVSDAKLSEPRLELLNKGLLGGRGFATGLTWFIEARKLDLREYLWIDALSGKLVLQFSQLTDAKDRQIYDANSSSTLPGTLVRVEGGPATGDPDADAAYVLSGETWGYFSNHHSRDSYDGAGATIISTVDYCSTFFCPLPNAFWNGTQMVYGAGYARADDVVAHELTHGVTEFTASLFYYMQSGALNESFSDIFGETVDRLYHAGTDTAAVYWQIGEDLPIGAIRDMMNPKLFGHPGKVSDPEFVCTGGIEVSDDAGGVHSNSGVPNHAYALMVEGGSYNGTSVTGIGFVKAGKIQYRALAYYLTSASDFLDNYHALKQSCQDLIGTSGITAAHCTEVGDALDAVEMFKFWPCVPTQAAVPAFCPVSKAPSLWFSWDVESSSLAPCPSVGFPSSWCLNGPKSRFGVYATSGVRSYWGYNRPTSGLMGLTINPGGTLPANARLQFNHSYGFENSATSNWDGGVVEYSTNGVSWTDGGSLITAGQTYGGTVSTLRSNPLGGNPAFVADSWGYTASQFDLNSLAGNSVSYRFVVGTDGSGSDYGWWVDDFRIYTCAGCVVNRVLNATYNGLASFYEASVSVEAGAGFHVGAMESVTLQAPEVRLTNDFEAHGNLTINSASCP